MSAATLWAEVVSRYDETSLIELTNLRNAAASEINTTVGQSAAQTVLGLWPVYAQIAYDSTDEAHVEAAVLGCIAVLWRRGGTAQEAEQVKWDEVWGEGGVITKIRRVQARGRATPTSDSTLTTRKRSWSETHPKGLLPSQGYTTDED